MKAENKKSNYLTKKEEKQMFWALMTCQYMFMGYAIFCFVYWWMFDVFGAIIMCFVGVYSSMLFHGFITHFDRNYEADLKEAIENDLYNGVSRKRRRSTLRKIFKKNSLWHFIVNQK